MHKNLCWFINQTTYCACGINTSNCLVRKASWLALPSSCKSASVKSIDGLLCVLPAGWWGHMSHRHTSYQPWLQQMQSLRQIHFSAEPNNNCYQPALWRSCIAASLTSQTLQRFSYTHILCLYRVLKFSLPTTGHAGPAPMALQPIVYILTYNLCPIHLRLSRGMTLDLLTVALLVVVDKAR